MKPALTFTSCLLFSIVSFSCQQSVSPVPKPKGHLRIDRAMPEGYAQVNFSGQSLSIAKAAKLVSFPQERFEIYYPTYQARWFGTLLPLTPKTNEAIFAESRQTIYRNVRSADQIQAAHFTNPERKVYALFYDLGAESATPFQFEVTDSTTRLLRGTLYFDIPVDPDSIAPVLEYLREDIIYLLEQFQWNP